MPSSNQNFQKNLKKSVVKTLTRFRSKKMFPETNIHKISESDPSFHVKRRTTRKGLACIFQELFASIKKNFEFGTKTGYKALTL